MKSGYTPVVGLCLLMMCSTLFAIDKPPPLRFMVKKFQVIGESLISESETQSILESYLGEHDGLEGLQAASDELEKSLIEKGYSFHRVSLPPQTLDRGIVKLEVVQFRIGEILVEKNRYFSQHNILRAMPGLMKNETPNTRRLARSLSIANAHPSKKIELLFKESKKPNAIDARLKVSDTKPGYFFTSLQNSGTEESGELRFSGGFQYSNLFGADHSIMLAYTTAPEDTEAVSQVGLNYRMPFYRLGGSLSFMYSDSSVDSGIVEEVFEVSGSGTVAGFRYNQNFLNIGAYKHSVSLAYSDKLFENDVTFSNTPIGTDVRSNPVTLSYAGSFMRASYSLSFAVSGVINVPSGNSSSDLDYDSARSGAVSEWSAARYNLKYYQRLGNEWMLITRFKGQSTSEPLIPGEQFGLGGQNSIRGFDERSVLADNGWSASMELWAKPLTKARIRPVLFYDAGHKEIENPQVGELAEADIASAGLSLQWSWRDKLNLRADYASVLEGINNTEENDTKLHLSLFYRF